MSRRTLPRLALAWMVLLAPLGLAQAGIWQDGNPPGLRGRQAIPGLTVKGSFSSYKLTGRHGRTVTVRLPRPQGLNEALALPAGEWTDLTLVLDGPVAVEVPGAPVVAVSLGELTVALHDPAAQEIHLEWSLPEGLLGALRAGGEMQGLGPALVDGAWTR